MRGQPSGDSVPVRTLPPELGSLPDRIIRRPALLADRAARLEPANDHSTVAGRTRPPARRDHEFSERACELPQRRRSRAGLPTNAAPAPGHARSGFAPTPPPNVARFGRPRCKLRISLGGQRCSSARRRHCAPRDAALTRLRPRLRCWLEGRRGRPASRRQRRGRPSDSCNEELELLRRFGRNAAWLSGASIEVVDPPSAQLLTVGLRSRASCVRRLAAAAAGARRVALETTPARAPWA